MKLRVALVLAAACGAAGAATQKVVPIVYADPSGRSALVVGAVRGAAWLNWEKAHRHLRPGQAYRFHSPRAVAGDRTVKAPALSQASGAAYNVNLTRPLPSRKGLLGLSGANWKVRPRPFRVLAGESAALTECIRALLAAKGVAAAKVQIVTAWEVDLDGDGRKEQVVEARSPEYEKAVAVDGPPVPVGGFSGVFLIQGSGGNAKTNMVAGAIHPNGLAEGGAPEQFELSHVADLNGDGAMEILVAWHYYEGGGVVAAQFKGGKLKAVLQASDGA